MPLGQQEQAFIDQLVAAGGRGFHEMEVAEARQAILQLFQVENPEPVATVEERTIPTPNGDLPIRIYTPEGDGPLPVLVFFTEVAGWSATSKATMQPVAP